MPVDPRIGKMLVFGAMLGCLNSILTIAGAMQGRGLFMSPREDADRQKANAARMALAKGSKSDHLTSVAAFNAWCVGGEGGGGLTRLLITVSSSNMDPHHMPCLKAHVNALARLVTFRARFPNFPQPLCAHARLFSRAEGSMVDEERSSSAVCCRLMGVCGCGGIGG